MDDADDVLMMRGSLPDAAAAAAAARSAGRHAGRTGVVLLSGGLDSATAAAWARDAGMGLVALSIDYGQRHRVELDAARAVAGVLGIVDHVMLAVDLAAFGGSALTDTGIAVPRGGGDGEIAGGIPVTYVPARNTVFLSLALALAEARGADCIVLGINAVDYSGYPDCRPEYLDAYARMAALATKAGVEGRACEFIAPLVDLSKEAIIRLGLALGVDHGLTTSCYDPGPDGRPCGGCDSCRIRAAGFAAAGAADPRIDPARWR